MSFSTKYSFEELLDDSKTLYDFKNEGLISEDCLTMDIYIPADLNEEAGILFWIHGGGYITGDSRMYTGIEHATKQGNIVVIIQEKVYRLNLVLYETQNRNAV